MRAAVLRGLGLLGLWLVLGGGAGPADLAVGLAAAALATRVSLALLPPARHGMAPGAALRLGLGVVRASVLAGFDIPLRALDPRLPNRPGLVAVSLGLPHGPARDGFRLLASLQPGTLPVGLDAEGRMLVHALDTSLPVEEETRAAEELFGIATGRGQGHG
jgi:multicomponent Na+:H+ antiporter subunit E